MKTKLILSILFSILVSIVGGVGIEMVTGFNAEIVTGVLFASSFIPMPSGMTMAGVYREVWTEQVKNELSTQEQGSFLDGIEDFSRYVNPVGDEAEAIHSTFMGVRPDVLINNTTYPIPIQELDGEDMVITLDKYQTKVTPVTDDELYALAYDKIAAVKGQHAKAIAAAKIKKALHAIAPADGAGDMPVLVTTGPDDGTGRLRLVWEDLVRLKAALDEKEVPELGRRLVLSTDHVNDLLLLDQKFKDQFFNATTGKPYNQLSFDFYSYIGAPYYNPATGTKLSYGAVPAATDRRASTFFSLERVAKASGMIKMYFQEAKTDPQNQRNLVNFRHNYIVMPTREEARGAIVSANAV